MERSPIRAESHVGPGGIAVRIVAIAVIYATFARLGLLLDPVGGFASVVWAPSGIAIASVLLFGHRVAVGVWLGAFAANLLTGAPVSAAAVIAIGNALEAIVALALLRRTSFDAALARLADVLVFALFAAIVAPAVSATIGVAALFVTNVVGADEVIASWRAWWVGDSIGAVLVAPAILVWAARGWQEIRDRLREVAALLLALALVAAVVFFARTPLEGTAYLQAYLVFPVLIWAALRFEQRGAVSAVLLTSIIAIVGTARGSGPFVEMHLRDSLFALQTFMGIVAVSFLALSAAIAEREEASRAAARLLTSLTIANRAKSDFLAAMSHELRTPLNAISGYAQLLNMDVHGELNANQRDAVQRIETNQRHLATLVADVLSFTSVESGRLALHATSVPLADSLAALSQFVAPEAERKGVALVIVPLSAPLTVHADPERLRQILLNLVVNAIKFSSPGGTVTLSAADANGFARITVADEGIGIPADQMQQVFDPFFQVDRGHARRYPGVGLGLTISRDLARAMGGDITLESAAGRGTRATVMLPLAAPGGSVAPIVDPGSGRST